MCGICGIVSSDPAGVLPAVVAGMNEAGRHRGPDDGGLLELPWAVLGHRRLSIIDLSPAGHQPMADLTGRYWITFNGEVYNYIEIRRELERMGHTFRTRTDTEVVLESVKEWGNGAFRRFNGMWALAIVDTAEKSVLLARDRFAVKPLYYEIRPGFLSFASELKQVLHASSGRNRLNHRVAADFLLWSIQGHCDETFVEGVRSFPGGHLAEVRLDDVRNGRLTPRPYWEPAVRAPMGLAERIEEFRSVFEDSVRLRLRSDVPVAVTLSGGLDSSSLACTAAAVRSADGAAGPLRAFTAVFPDRGYSEEGFARLVAERSGLDHQIIRPDQQHLVEDWRTFVRCMDEPFFSLSYFANWKVYQRIRDSGVPVVLNGQGGDELLLGYPRYRPALLTFLARSRKWGALARELAFSSKRGNLSVGRLAAMGLYFRFPGLRVRRRLEMMRPLVRPEFLAYGRSRAGTLKAEAELPSLRELIRHEFAGQQLQHLLHHEDRVSMHFAVEARNPFLDYRLFEIAASSPPEALLHEGWSKHLLREAMRGRLPEEIRVRTDKMGFDTPTGRLLSGGKVPFSDLLRRNGADRLLDTSAIAKAFSSGSINENVLCSALSYLTWAEEFGVFA
jgi:asparagine synthase (glutamine-hydrolysing)